MNAAQDIETHRPYLLRFAMLQLRDSSAAEDAVQETLLAAIQGIANFSGGSSLRTWLVGILKHKIIDHIRRQQKSVSLDANGDEASLDDIDELFRSDGHYAQDPAAWQAPDAALHEKDFFHALERCMAGLPDKTARVFVMREVLEMETAEICKQLGITSTNCWVLLYRARMALRVCLEQGWFGARETG